MKDYEWRYDHQVEAGYLKLSNKPVAQTIELLPTIFLDKAEDGSVIGVEILNMKLSEVFEEPNSSLRKAFEEVKERNIDELIKEFNELLFVPIDLGEGTGGDIVLSNRMTKEQENWLRRTLAEAYTKEFNEGANQQYKALEVHLPDRPINSERD